MNELRTRLINFIAKDRVKELVLQGAASAKKILDIEIRDIEITILHLEEQKKGETNTLKNKKEEYNELLNELKRNEKRYIEDREELIEFSERQIEMTLERAKDRTLNRITNFNIEKDELVALTSSEIMKSMKSAVNKIQHQFVEYFGKKMLKPEIFLNEDIGHALKKENSINRLEIVRGVSGLSTIAGLGTAGYLTLTAGSWAAVALGAASGGATVAGIGAGLGSIAGPIGAGIGAGIGVVAGAVAGAGGAAMATATLPVAPFLIFSTLSAGACYTANSFLKKSKNSKTRTSIHQYFEDVSEKMKESLNETIDTFFRMTVKNINREVTEKIESLERIIAEKKPEVLEIEITECNAKREKLSNYSEILNGYTENAAMSG